MSEIQWTVTTGDGVSACPCSLHRCEPAIGIAPWYRVHVAETSFIARGLSLPIPQQPMSEEHSAEESG